MSLIFRSLRPFITMKPRSNRYFSSNTKTLDSKQDYVERVDYVKQHDLSDIDYECVLAYIHSGNIPYTEENVRFLVESLNIIDS
jgi:hypothetical protein